MLSSHHLYKLVLSTKLNQLRGSALGPSIGRKEDEVFSVVSRYRTCSKQRMAPVPVSLLQFTSLEWTLQLYRLSLQNYIKVTRMFVGEPVWTAHKRPGADGHPARAQYLKDLHAGKFPRV